MPDESPLNDQARRTRHESEEHWRHLVETHPDSIIIIEGAQLTYANEATAELLGVECPADLVGREVQDFIAPEDRAKFKRRNKQLRQGREVPPTLYHVQRADDAKRQVEVYVSLTQYEGRRAHQVVVRDVTERRERAERLRRQQDALRRLTHRQIDETRDLDATLAQVTETLSRTLETARVSVWLRDDDRSAFYCRDRYDRDHGEHTQGKTREIQRHTDYLRDLNEERISVFSDAQNDDRVRSFLPYFKDNNIGSIMSAPIHVDGRLVGVLLHEHRGGSRSWTSDEQHFAGSAANLAALALESDRRRRTEKALRSSRARYRHATDTIGEVLFRTDERGQWVFLNSTWEDVMGFPVEESLGEFFLEHVHPDDYERELEKYRALYANDTEHLQNQMRIRREDGETRWIEAQSHVIRDEAGRLQGTTGTFRDITERKEAEQALRRNRELLSSINENVTEAIYRSKQEGGLVYVNQAFVRMFGYDSTEEVLNAPSASLYADPEERERGSSALNEEGITGNQEVQFRRKDGSTFWGLLNSRAVYDDDGNLTYWDGAITDITERKERERELVAAKEEAEKMNRLKSTFLTNMSHEIRTPLTSIIGFADVLSDELDSEDQLELVSMIRRSGNRLMDTLNSVLHLSQLEGGSLELSLQALDVAEIIDETVPTFRVQAEKKDLTLTVENRADGEPLTARLDRDAFHRILSNLISNAIKFTERGGVTVCLDASDDTVRVSVRDTGVGINPSFQDEMFEEFKQESSGLSREHEGSGLGLAITQRLARRMDGRLTAESTEGEGSTFTVLFPRLDENERAPEGT
jgi:PAS domain S-box-containing protein